MRKSLIIPALGLILASTAGAAFASSDDNRSNVPQTGWMTIPQIAEKLAGEGYQVRQIKMERRGYEVYAIDKDGRRVEAYVDPVSGNLVGSEVGEDD
jgi:hypothetical protein